MGESKSHQIAAQNNAIRTKYVKARIDKTQQNVVEDNQQINHIRDCYKLMQKEYKTRHD